MPIKVLETRLGRKYLKSTITLESAAQKSMGIDKPDCEDIEFTFDPCAVISWYKHEYDESDKWNRTLIEFTNGQNTSIGCDVKEFEKVFLSL